MFYRQVCTKSFLGHILKISYSRKLFSIILWQFLLLLVIEVFSFCVIYSLEKKDLEKNKVSSIENLYLSSLLKFKFDYHYIEFRNPFRVTNSVISFLVPDTLLGIRNADNIKIKFADTEESFFTNPQGFSVSEANRYKFYLKNKTPYTFRVILLGGSTVFGEGSSRPELNIANLLERELSQELNMNVEVINAGVVGYSSAQELLYFISELKNYNPDVIISYNGWNDSYYNKIKYLNKPGQTSSLKTLAHLNLEDRVLRSYNLVGNLKHFLFNFRSVLNQFAFVEIITRVVEEFKDFEKVETEVSFDEKYSKEYFQNEFLLQAIASSLNISSVFLLQPIMGVSKKPFTKRELSLLSQVYDSDFRKYFYKSSAMHLDQLNKSRFATSCFRDLSNIFQNNFEDVFFDTGHLNDLGNSIVAGRIKQVLSECKILPDRFKNVASARFDQK